jgi:hypothetical protein
MLIHSRIRTRNRNAYTETAMVISRWITHSPKSSLCMKERKRFTVWGLLLRL